MPIEADRDIGENPKHPAGGTRDGEGVVVEDVVVVLEPCELDEEEHKSSMETISTNLVLSLVEFGTAPNPVATVYGIHRRHWPIGGGTH